MLQQPLQTPPHFLKSLGINLESDTKTLKWTKIFTQNESLKTNPKLYGCFLKWWYPPNTPKWSFLVGKPMVVGEAHHFRKPPYTSIFFLVWHINPKPIIYLDPKPLRFQAESHVQPSLYDLGALPWEMKVFAIPKCHKNPRIEVAKKSIYLFMEWPQKCLDVRCSFFFKCCFVKNRNSISCFGERFGSIPFHVDRSSAVAATFWGEIYEMLAASNPLCVLFSQAEPPSMPDCRCESLGKSNGCLKRGEDTFQRLIKASKSPQIVICCTTYTWRISELWTKRLRLLSQRFCKTELQTVLQILGFLHLPLLSWGNVTEQKNLGGIALFVFAVVLLLHADLNLAPGRMQGWEGRKFMAILVCPTSASEISTKNLRNVPWRSTWVYQNRTISEFDVLSIFMSGIFPATK